MKVAMIIKDKKLKKLNVNAMRVFIFDVQDNKISSTEVDLLYKRDINYVSLWFLSKQINVVYVEDADDKTRDFFHKIDIIIKTYEDMEDDPIFKSFVI